MKRTYTLFLAVIALAITSFSNAQTVILTAPAFSSTPMGTAENNSGVVGSVEFRETTGENVKSTAFGEPNVTINVNFQYVKLSNDDVDGISGTLLEYFEPHYNPTTNILILKQSGLIPGGWKGVANIPMDVTQNSTEDQSYNGFNANIAAIDGKTAAVGSAAVFSYTDKMILSSNNLDLVSFNVNPIPTQDFLNIELDNNFVEKVQIFDVYGKLVFDEDYTSNFSKKIRLNIRHLASAVYVLKVTAGNDAFSTRIIRE